MASSPSSPLVVDAVGVRVGIDLAGLSSVDRDVVARAWADARVDGSTAEATVSPVSSDREGQTLSDLSSTVTQAAIQARRGELWMLHAAGLAAPDGGVVVLAGPSGAGKTTATRLLATSWGYVSDETIGLESDGRVHSYRKPLSVITEGHGFKVQHAPGDLGLLPLPSAPLRLRRVVLLDRAAAHTGARLVPVPMSEALVLLAPHSSALTSLPAPLRMMRELLARTGGLVRAEYAEAADLPALVGDAMHGHRDAAVEPVALDLNASVSNPAPPEGTPRYRRGPVVDTCPLPDDRLAVLTAEADGRGVLRILAGAAPALWRAANEATRDDLLRAVTGGETDEDAERHLDAILSQLVEARLLEITA